MEEIFVKDGLIDSAINCIEITQNGDIWIGTKKGFSKFANNSFANYLLPASKTNNNDINSIVEDNNTTLWISANIDTNIWSIPIYTMETKTNKFENVYDKYGICLGEFFKMYLYNSNLYRINLHKDLNGNIFTFGTNNCIIKFNSNSVEKYYLTVASSYLNYYNVRFSSDAKGRLFFVSNNGGGLTYLYSFDPSKYSYYNYNTFINPQSNKRLDVNNVNASIIGKGVQFFSSKDPIGLNYEVPKGSCKSSLFCTGLWIGGLDSLKRIRGSASTYLQSGSDYSSGPIDSVTGYCDSITSNLYDRVWQIDRGMIDKFIDEYDKGNVTNGKYAVPNDITTWPAKYADYVDFNKDGKYNPMDKDYPKLLGDMMTFSIFNDTTINKADNETQGLAVGAEVHCTTYSFYCDSLKDSDSSSALNYTTFYRYKVINRSKFDYTNFYISLFVDPDLGNYNDDFIGCDSANNNGYCYNGDNNDEGWNGYGLNPPMIAVKILNMPMTNFMIYNNDFTVMGNPEKPEHYYYYQQSRWLDYKPLTFGKDVRGGSRITNYFYSGLPYLSSEWNEKVVGSAAGGRKFVMGSGPFNLKRNERKTIDFAVVWSRDSSHSNGLTTSYKKNLSYLNSVANWYKNNNYPSCYKAPTSGINESAKSTSNTIAIYPNPFNSATTIHYSINKNEYVNHKRERKSDPAL
ncbi:MAG: hypothetical protein NTX03_02270 [Bacteroidetes bacterium]|nr:hypothetical protein [Bacteroidota bacterium]